MDFTKCKQSKGFIKKLKQCCISAVLPAGTEAEVLSTVATNIGSFLLANIIYIDFYCLQ